MAKQRENSAFPDRMGCSPVLHANVREAGKGDENRAAGMRDARRNGVAIGVDAI